MQQAGGDKVRQFVGEGQRQYLTGIKLNGARTLVLIDSSASMLDTTIVDIIRRRNQSDEIKRQSEKWQQTLSIADWILTNLEPDSRFQLFSFNTEAQVALSGSETEWLNASNQTQLNDSIAGLNSQIPTGGTSLVNVFSEISALNPRPDNIFLVTDGLPTQGLSLIHI